MEDIQHLAEQELASHLECNTTSSSDFAKSRATSDGNKARWETIVAA